MTDSNRPSAPYYQDEQVTLYHGHCLDLFASTSWHTDARIITDPPYGFGAYETDIAPDLNLFARWVRDNRTVAVFGYPEGLARLCARRGLEPSEWVTWWPTNKHGSPGDKLLPRESEHVAIFGEIVGGSRLRRTRASDSFGRRWAEQHGHSSEEARLGDVWTDPAPGVKSNSHLRLHPNEKPLSLMSKLVQLCSNPGEIVLDPFAGSGTTLVAAKSVGRKAIGIEIEERYCEIAASRCAQEVLAVA